jgi:hypothetical protein
MSIQKITHMAAGAIIHGYAEEIVRLNEVLAFDMRFNLRHPKIAALYMLETPINGAHFEVVKRDGNRYHVGGDIAAKILGEEKAYMSTLENVATQAKEQTGLIKQFCRKCNLFDKLYPQEAQEQQLKDRQKLMEEQYMDQAGGIMARLSKIDKVLPLMPVNPARSTISAAVSERLRTKLRTNCEIQYAVTQAHIQKWIDLCAEKTGHVLSFTENFRDSDPTGNLRFQAQAGELTLTRDGEVVGKWDSYEDAHAFLRLGTNTLPNPVLPLTKQSYARTVDVIPVDEAVLREAISAQVTETICDSDLWKHLKS